MKATGIVRKIDELGRIVIPREIRKSLRIREGNPLEIYVEKNGEIILKKYAPMGDILELTSQYADTIASTTGFAVCISDTEMIISVSGTSKKDYLDKEISEHVQNVMEERAMWSTKDDTIMPIIKNDNTSKYCEQIVCPIISEADAVGTVILFTTDARKKITDVEYKLVQSACSFLSKQMEV